MLERRQEQDTDLRESRWKACALDTNCGCRVYFIVKFKQEHERHAVLWKLKSSRTRAVEKVLWLPEQLLKRESGITEGDNQIQHSKGRQP